MPHLLDLPSELLTQIVRHVNTNGDLPRLRQTSLRLSEIAEQQACQFLDGLCHDHGITPRALGFYFVHILDKSTWSTAKPTSTDVIALDHFLRNINRLAAEVGRALHQETTPNVAPRPSVNGNTFVLFAILSRLLRSSQTVMSLSGTLLAPCSSGATFAPKLLSGQFVQYLMKELTLSELESVISVINMCATRLWGSVFLFKPKDLTVSSFGSLSGYTFNTDQAILTEHVIWKGPKWVARVLRNHSHDTQSQQPFPMAEKEFEDELVKGGIWRGTRENGALLAANGVARLLWKERQHMIEQRKAGTPPQAATVTEMHTNPAVWRGSSGDM